MPGKGFALRVTDFARTALVSMFTSSVPTIYEAVHIGTQFLWFRASQVGSCTFTGIGPVGFAGSEAFHFFFSTAAGRSPPLRERSPIAPNRWTR
jgi:hypothetical protein